MNCRHCEAPLHHVMIDLGHQPASNAYLLEADLAQGEVYAPLKTFVCDQCWLVQLPSYHRSDELFTSDYAYFSSTSTGWVAHAEKYAIAMVERFALGADDWVLEVASNDGYLLQFFNKMGIPSTGIEPTHSTAEAARKIGVESIERFFGREFAAEMVAERGNASLTAANNVLAHVPDINDFVGGFAVLLAPNGVATFEFPHVQNLVDLCQFDTIYHEHFSYLSLTAVQRIFSSQGLRVFDVEKISTHGGSLRVFACQNDAVMHRTLPAVARVLAEEAEAGLTTLTYYDKVAPAAQRIKLDLLDFLVREKRAGRSIGAYGAAAKGNTLLNFAGVHADMIDFVCDAAPSKQGRFLPGSHIPILAPAALYERKPDYVLILPWNIKEEVVAQHSKIAEWAGKFVVAVPGFVEL